MTRKSAVITELQDVPHLSTSNGTLTDHQSDMSGSGKNGSSRADMQNASGAYLNDAYVIEKDSPYAGMARGEDVV
jgi:hypothetical protein